MEFRRVLFRSTVAIGEPAPGAIADRHSDQRRRHRGTEGRLGDPPLSKDRRRRKWEKLEIETVDYEGDQAEKEERGLERSDLANSNRARRSQGDRKDVVEGKRGSGRGRSG